jgi:hypothetical protein
MYYGAYPNCEVRQSRWNSVLQRSTLNVSVVELRLSDTECVAVLVDLFVLARIVCRLNPVGTL